MSTRSTCALILLCIVQGCERFAFFAMLPLFVLYLHHRHGLTEPSALLLMGVFQALSYFGGLPAGAVTDRKLGPIAALVLGGALLSLSVGARLLPVEAGHTISDSQKDQTPEDSRTRWSAVWLLCGLAVVFWLTVQQAGSSLVLFAELHTERSIAAFGHSFAIGPAHFASMHALLVLVLLLVFVVGLGQFRQADAGASIPIRLVWGYIATSAAFELLAAAGLYGSGTCRASPIWLAGCYLLLSVAELLLGPLGMALLTQLAPPRRTAQAVGLWFAAAAVGNGAAGALGLLWSRWPNHRYFALLALVSLGAALALFSRLPLLERLLNASRQDAQGDRP